MIRCLKELERLIQNKKIVLKNVSFNKVVKIINKKKKSIMYLDDIKVPFSENNLSKDQ